MSPQQIINLAATLGWQDLKDSYRRSKLGTFWVTLGMTLQIATIGFVFAMIFSSNLDDYLPYLAIGIIFWTYMTATLTEGSSAFIAASAIIKQLPIPPMVFLLRNTWKNTIVLGHNILIIPVVLILFSVHLGMGILVSVAGFVLLTANLFWMTTLLAIAATRFRDIPPMVNSVLHIAFYVTPIMWSPMLIPSGLAHNLLGLNPFYHFIQLVRLPLMGGSPTFENWFISLTFLFVGSIITYFILLKFKSRLAYWV